MIAKSKLLKVAIIKGQGHNVKFDDSCNKDEGYSYKVDIVTVKVKATRSKLSTTAVTVKLWAQSWIQ